MKIRNLITVFHFRIQQFYVNALRVSMATAVVTVGSHQLHAQKEGPTVPRMVNVCFSPTQVGGTVMVAIKWFVPFAEKTGPSCNDSHALYQKMGSK